VGEQKCMSPCF
jgi:hypothetical protein